MKALILCEESQRVTAAFRARGHTAFSCDLKPGAINSEWHIQDDALKVAAEWKGWPDLIIAHPDCTYFSNSGVQWLTRKPGRWQLMTDAARFYNELWARSIAAAESVCFENPVMNPYAQALISPCIPKRVFVQPHFFGEPMFKRTGYALHNLLPLKRTHWMTLPEKDTVEYKKWSWVWYCPPGPNRKQIRSRTPLAIADAFAEQWGAYIEQRRAA